MVKIKVRQPLAQVLVDGSYNQLIGDLTPLIKEELNIKEVVFADDLHEYLEYSLKPNFKVAGPALGSGIKAFGKAVAALDPAAAMANLDKEGSLVLELDGVNTTITKNMIEVIINTRDGFAAATENSVFTIINTNLTQDLVEEGFAREIISKIQQMRKQKDLEMTDHISITLMMNDQMIEIGRASCRERV